MGHKGKSIHLSTQHWVDDTRIMIKECRSLAADGWRITYVCHSGQENVPDLSRNITVHMIDLPNRSVRDRLRIIKAICDILRKHQADIYHFHDPELIPVGLLLKLQGKKVIYDVHEDVPRQILSKHWIAKPLRKTIAWLVERVENFAAKRFDAVVAAEISYCNRFRQLNCNIVNVNNYPILKELEPSNIDWSQKESAVCYVGGISRIRGIYKMIEAMAQTNVKLLLAGRFSSADERNRAVTMPGWDRVEELGQLNRDEVKGTLLKSKAGLSVLFPVPNYVISQPTKMLEYMSSGIPVISSDFPLWKEIIEGNQCGICVDPMNPQAIAQAIQWIVDNPDEAKQMGENGRRAVEEKYNWESESQKLLAMYGDLLKNDDK